MASVSVSHMILFIASMLVAASVAGVFTDTVGQLSGAIDDQGLQVSEEIRTDVEVISDSGSTNIYDAGANVITLYVKNTGSETLAAETDAINVFVNGQFVPGSDVSVTLTGDATRWRPGEVARVEVTEPGLSGDVRVQLTVDGDEEVFEFRT